jgi:hypothetical protein
MILGAVSLTSQRLQQQCDTEQLSQGVEVKFRLKPGAWQGILGGGMAAAACW